MPLHNADNMAGKIVDAADHAVDKTYDSGGRRAGQQYDPIAIGAEQGLRIRKLGGIHQQFLGAWDFEGDPLYGQRQAAALSQVLDAKTAAVRYPERKDIMAAGLARQLDTSMTGERRQGFPDVVRRKNCIQHEAHISVDALDGRRSCDHHHLRRA